MHGQQNIKLKNGGGFAALQAVVLQIPVDD